jgi:RNA polymerase sigma-70 factor, ECF subfamily
MTTKSKKKRNGSPLTREKFEEKLTDLHRRALATTRIIIRDEQWAEDAAQDAMLRAVKYFSQFDGRSSIETWVRRIAVNAAYDLLRKARLRAAPILTDLEITGSGGDVVGYIGISPKNQCSPPSKLLIQFELGRVFSPAMERMSESNRQMLILRFVEGLSIEELAKVFRLTEGTVKAKLFRARRFLRKKMIRSGYTGSFDFRPVDLPG